MKYKGFEGPPYVSVVSWHVQLMTLQAGDTTRCTMRGLSRHMCFNWLSRKEKVVRLSLGSKVFCGRFLYWHKEAHLFRHAWIVLPVGDPLNNCCFVFIYFISCLFYLYLYYVIAFLISYLIPTSFCQWSRVSFCYIPSCNDWHYRWSEK